MTMIPAIDAQGVVMHTDNGETWRRVAQAGAGGLRRVAGNAWPLLQGTAAATAAWVIARRLGDHPDPFFARSPRSWRSTPPGESAARTRCGSWWA
jgi:hypothetical protein